MATRRTTPSATARHFALATCVATLVGGCAGSDPPARVDAVSTTAPEPSIAPVSTVLAGARSTTNITNITNTASTAPAPTTTGSTSTVAPTIASTSAATSPVTARPTTVTTLPAVTPPLLAGLATEPAGLGAQLTAALRTIVDPSSPPAAVEAAGQRQQFVIRRLAAHQDWQAAALSAVGDDVRPIAANDLAAINAPGNAALAKPVAPKPTLPAWRIRAPLPTDELRGYYQEAEAATGIEWVYLAAINLVETRMGRIVGLSPDGAVGPMQFLPSTWRACCSGDPAVDHDAIIGAATYLVRRGGPADMRRAILGYNPNDAYLEMIDRYADNLRTNPQLLAGYHAWQVFVTTTEGPVRLPVGFETPEPLDAATYLATHPDDRA